MRIIGPDELRFGVDDVAAAETFLRDYGLKDAGGGRFEGLDGTCLVIKNIADPSLPAPLPTSTKLRKTIWGVEDQASLDAIEAELSRDRTVVREADGSLSTRDDLDFAIGFRITRRHTFDIEPELINTPGIAAGRPNNKIGAVEDEPALPVTLSHVVYFVPDVEKMERFYVDRLKFNVSDRFTGIGPFLSPQACGEHHTLFLIQTPPQMQGLEHFAFHMRGPNALMLAGNRMREKGYQTHWGPGKHLFGSNWFWYFKSPLGCAIEYDADMDRRDEAWVAREGPAGADYAQIYLLKSVAKWAPFGGPPTGSPYQD